MADKGEYMYRISFYVPESHLEQVKQALFDAGAGRFKNYDCCAWQTLGTGQFRPLVGSSPFIGKTNAIELGQEYKVEMICKDELIKQAITALKTAHPYEELAYEFYRIENS